MSFQSWRDRKALDLNPEVLERLLLSCIRYLGGGQARDKHVAEGAGYAVVCWCGARPQREVVRPEGPRGDAAAPGARYTGVDSIS